MRLFDCMTNYAKSKYYPYHMPGHKRNMKKYGFQKMYRIDLTEIDGFDDLYHPCGIIRNSMIKTARLFGSETTYFSVNGSTGAVLTAISAATNLGGTILMARNCHKSIYNAVYLRQLKREIVQPMFVKEYDICGSVSPVEVQKAIENNSLIQAVVITSPTAEGIVSDIERIARICHEHGKILIVDEAHGAHFGFDEHFPKSSVQCGADLVIQSVHKTLPSLTQTALLHVSGDLVDRQMIEYFFQIYQTTSPSYLLMGSIDNCVHILENDKEKLFQEFNKRIDEFSTRAARLTHIKVMGIKKDDIGEAVFSRDPGKLLISVKGSNISGPELYDYLLNKYHLQFEMKSKNSVLAIMTVMDSKKGFKRLIKALEETDKTLVSTQENEISDQNEIISQEIMTIYEASKQKGQAVKLSECIDRISKEYIYVYPPGVPLAVPGEKISEGIIEKIKEYKKFELNICGMEDNECNTLIVVANK